MNAIAAVDEKWGIGYKNRLLFHIPADLQRFKELTWGGAVIVGRKTLEGFPGGQGLPGRENYILSRKQDYTVRGGRVLHSREELFEELKKLREKKLLREEKIFVAGGESIYRQFLPYCSTIYLTRVDGIFPADSYFPDISCDGQWELVEESEHFCWNKLHFFYQKYQNPNHKS